MVTGVRGPARGIPEKEQPSAERAANSTGVWTPEIPLLGGGEPSPCRAVLMHGWAEERAH